MDSVFETRDRDALLTLRTAQASPGNRANAAKGVKFIVMTVPRMRSFEPQTGPPDGIRRMD